MPASQPVNTLQDLIDGLGECEADQLVFVGLGNRDRGDDAAGLVLLSQLQEVPDLAGAHFINAGRTPENYLQHLLNLQPELVIFLDAVRWGGEPGEVTWLSPAQIETAGMSTHTYSIRMIEQYLQAQRPMEVKYLGIQPVSTGLGEPISDEVSSRIQDLLCTPER